MNIGEGGNLTLPGGCLLYTSDDADEKEDQHRNDQDCLEEEILIHERLQPLGLCMVLRGRQGDDGGTGDFDLNVVRGNPEDDRIILNGPVSYTHLEPAARFYKAVFKHRPLSVQRFDYLDTGYPLFAPRWAASRS